MNDKYDFITPSAATGTMTSSPAVDYLVASSDPASRMQQSPLGGPQMNTHNPPPAPQRPATNINNELIYTNNNVNNNYDVTPIKPQQSINLRNLLHPEADTTTNVTSQPQQQQQLNENNDEDMFMNHWFQQQSTTTATPQPQPQPQQRIYTNLTPVVEPAQPQQQPQAQERINIYNTNNIPPQQQLEYNDHPVTYTPTYQPQPQQYQSYGYAAAASPGQASAYNQSSLIPVVGYNQTQQPQPRINPQQPTENMGFEEDPSRGVSARSKNIRKKPRYPAKGTSEYVEHRRKNNEAVRRSRAKQKMKQLQQSKELENLKRENNYYRCQLNFNEQQHHRNNNM